MNQQEQTQKPPPVPEAEDNVKSEAQNSHSANKKDPTRIRIQANTSRDSTHPDPTDNPQSSSMACCADSARVGPINAHPTHVLMVPNTVTVTRTIPVPAGNCPPSGGRSQIGGRSCSSSSFQRMCHSTNDIIGGSASSVKNISQNYPQQYRKQQQAPIHGFQCSEMEDASGLVVDNIAASANDDVRGLKSGENYSSPDGEIIGTHQTETDGDGQMNQIDINTIQMTVEQIDDVIDKVDLPTNFSFPPTKKKPKARKAPILPISPKRAKLLGSNLSESNNVSFMSMTPTSAFTSDMSRSNSFLAPASNIKLQSKKRKAELLSLSPRKPSPTNMNRDDVTTTVSSSSSSSLPYKKSPTSGRWTREEHEAFLEGLKIFGREWKKVAQNIPTRTSAQIRSHAQKYFAKLARDEQQQAANASLGLGYPPNMSLGLDLGGVGLGANTGNLGVAAAGEGCVLGEGIARGSGGGEFTQSVLERVDKILRDPEGAQQEVEETLSRLRVRYNELQKKIMEQQRQKEEDQFQRRLRQQLEDRLNVGSSQYVNQYDGRGSKTHDYGGLKDAQVPSTNIQFAPMAQAQNVVEMTELERPSHTINRPDMGTLKCTSNTDRYSTASRSAPPMTGTRTGRMCPITLSTKSLALHSEELIALHVLGGELYRSASRENLHALGKDDRTDSNPHNRRLNEGSPGSDASDNGDNRSQSTANDDQNS